MVANVQIRRCNDRVNRSHAGSGIEIINRTFILLRYFLHFMRFFRVLSLGCSEYWLEILVGEREMTYNGDSLSDALYNALADRRRTKCVLPMYTAVTLSHAAFTRELCTSVQALLTKTSFLQLSGQHSRLWTKFCFVMRNTRLTASGFVSYKGYVITCTAFSIIAHRLNIHCTVQPGEGKVYWYIVYLSLEWYSILRK